MGKFDKISNIPFNDKIINDLWIYEGKDISKLSNFSGSELNKSPKALYSNMKFLSIIIQINKSILGIFQGNYEEYNPTKYYEVGDTVKTNNEFYISLIDENSKSLTDENYWYKFSFSNKFLLDFNNLLNLAKTEQI